MAVTNLLISRTVDIVFRIFLKFIEDQNSRWQWSHSHVCDRINYAWIQSLCHKCTPRFFNTAMPTFHLRKTLNLSHFSQLKSALHGEFRRHIGDKSQYTGEKCRARLSTLVTRAVLLFAFPKLCCLIYFSLASFTAFQKSRRTWSENQPEVAPKEPQREVTPDSARFL